jgi:hypothetical protein
MGWYRFVAATNSRHGCGCGERDSSCRMVVSFWRLIWTDSAAVVSDWRRGVFS